MVTEKEIAQAVSNRSAQFRESRDEVTPRKCRRVLEADLGLRSGELDSPEHKFMVAGYLDSFCLQARLERIINVMSG